MPIQDVSPEELKKMGFREFRVVDDGLTIHPDDVEAFEEWANTPLTDEEIEYNKRCYELYKNMKVRSSR